MVPRKLDIMGRIHFHLNHPAHYHLFRNAINCLISRGEDCIVTIVKKDILEELVSTSNWNYVNLFPKGRRKSGSFSIIFMLYYLLKTELVLFRFILRENISISIATEGTIAHVCFLLRRKSILVNEDDTKATPENYLFYPFSSTLILPNCCDPNKWKKKRISYQGYHELAYLDPLNFLPNAEILTKYGIKPEEYYVIRLAELTASHDFGKVGINDSLLGELIDKLSEKGKVYITSERMLKPNFEKYRLQIDPKDIFHILSYSKIYIGDSQTMAAEAAILGVPSVRFSGFIGNLGYLDELENKYQLTYGIHSTEPNKLMDRITDLLAFEDLKKEWSIRVKIMLKECTSPTQLILNEIDRLL